MSKIELRQYVRVVCERHGRQLRLLNLVEYELEVEQCSSNGAHKDMYTITRQYSDFI